MAPIAKQPDASEPDRHDRHSDASRMPEELTQIRHSIDNIDAALIYLLAERFTYTQRVGRLKARFGLPPADPAREAEQIARLRRLAESARLDPAFAEKFLGFVVEEVIRHHRAIAEEDGVGPEPQPETAAARANDAPSTDEGMQTTDRGSDLGD